MNFCSQCGFKLESNANYCINCGHQLPQVKQNQNNCNFEEDIYYFKKMEKSMKDARTSFVLGIIPIILYFYCLFSSHGDTSEEGAGAVWWLIVLYYMTVVIPFTIISFISGVKSYRVCKDKLALYGIIFSCLHVLFLIFQSLFA